ncbi:nucleolar protein [Sporothrix epigloea]|uniref:Nucleolar protein n=1 Tax=Sporothrix epigloea TaxID=1892477 RepID=A0ABP0E4S1_9PEZI
MAKETKVKAAASGAAPRKSSRISAQVDKRKGIDAQQLRMRDQLLTYFGFEAVEQSSPVAAKKRKAPEEPAKEKKAAPQKAPARAKQTNKKTAKPADDDEDETETLAVENDATTMALVQEIDGSDDDEDGKAAAGASLFQRGQDVGSAPTAAVKNAIKLRESEKKMNNAKSMTLKDKTTTKHNTAVPAASTSTVAKGGDSGGVVYVGRIPHGFFEHEMRSYFSQFGDIRNLRLSRNRKTGASKHYAFIEFSDREVADIVAKTMDNYLLFGHLLRCSVVTPERIPANLFKGANRRFKAVPWNRMAGRKLAQAKPESEWADKISRETKRRTERAALLKSKLNYSFAAPELKTTDTVEAPPALEKMEDKEVEAPRQLQEATPAEDAAAPAKGKKSKSKKVAA